MKKFAFWAVIAIAFASCSRTSDTIIRFHSEGSPLRSTPILMTKDSTYTLPIDSTQSVVYTLPAVFEPAYGALFLDDSHVLLYIEPGKGFDVTIKMEEGKPIPTFTGKGAGKNRYLNNDSLHYTPDYNLTEAEFMTSLDACLKNRFTFLDAQHFDAPFTELEKKRLTYTVYASLPDYPGYHVFQTQQWEYQPTQAYYDKIDSIFTEDADLVDLAVYQQFIRRYVVMKQAQNVDNISDLQYARNELDYVTRHFREPAVIEHLVDNIIYAYVERLGISDLPSLSPFYENYVHSVKKKATFKALCDKWIRIAPGQPSPSFAYRDINGQEVSLSDLAGKYVYIDVWATRCGPCCRELPALKKLEEKYAHRNIHFVSISCDQDRSVWEKFVKEEKLNGIQLQSFRNDDFIKTYMISTIPRFILIDREGRIMNAHMSRPSEPETEKFIETLEGL